MLPQEAAKDHVKQVLANYLELSKYLDQEIRLREELVNQVLTDQQRQEIEDINEEFGNRHIALKKRLEELEEEIKGNVLKLGETVVYGPHKAVYNKGRVSWDTEKLEGLILAVPQLEKLRKEGKPFVSIKVKQDDK